MPSNAQESYEENKEFDYRESVAGSVIQATGTVEFEDDLRMGVLENCWGFYGH